MGCGDSTGPRTAGPIFHKSDGIKQYNYEN
ncbi:hypothetical protein SAMN05421640_2636 [Ekhidna lutea]|uniref:Uncharacterized protein n=1 Tax=Ekhidna lutea TaxID=447679 RepID=A0A239KHB2_EKHLU|nr:hypothetical protein SAMN05421640_2636 [Ekhidna lutea]